MSPNDAQGFSVNDYIRQNQQFRNPDILEKLVDHFSVHEFGTNYPSKIYNPSELSRDEHYDRLEALRKKWEERQMRQPGAKVAFTSAGSQPAAGGASMPVLNQPKKSKWDGAVNAEPPAKRPA